MKFVARTGSPTAGGAVPPSSLRGRAGRSRALRRAGRLGERHDARRPRGVVPRVEAELRVDGVLEAQPLAAALLPELVEGLHVALRVRRGVRAAALRADRLDRQEGLAAAAALDRGPAAPEVR